MVALNQALNFLFPPRCAGCDVLMPIESSARICARCMAAIERLREPLCVRCGIPLQSWEARDPTCDLCRRAPPHFGKARAIARYRRTDESGDFASVPVLPSLIRRHKYGLDQSL